MYIFYNKNKIFRIFERLSENQWLSLNHIFKRQKKLVNNILILIIQKTINRNIFSVVNNIIKYIIHEWYYHQYEKFLKKIWSDKWKDNKKRMKHNNLWYTYISK